MAKITEKGKRKITGFMRRQTENAARNSRRLVPVDSGKLQQSISVYQGDEKGSWILGSDVDYAALVEFGAGSREPQAFIRPAMRRLGRQ